MCIDTTRSKTNCERFSDPTRPDPTRPDPTRPRNAAPAAPGSKMEIRKASDFLVKQGKVAQ